MIDHLSTCAKDYPATKVFYDAIFAALGYSLQTEFVAEWNQDFPTQKMCAFGVDGKPGLRPVYHEHYYGAFTLDPDGNNVEAVCHAPE